jgi:membrane protease YdiL (CAAX protease family)
MSDSQSSATLDPSCVPSCDPWKFWATSAWTAAAIAAWVAVQFIVFFGVLFYVATVGEISVDELSAGDIEKLASHAIVLSLVAILAAPAEIGVIAFAVRFARCRFADYLALIRPSRKYLLIGLACLVVLLPLADLATWMTGRGIVPPFVVEAYRSARDSGTIWLLAIALVIAAPLTEEIVFRGFMYRGLAASRLGEAGAILIPSVIWASMHVQYEVFFIVQIFLLGVVFGVLRWKSGSTWLTIVLHAIVNLSSLLQTVYFVEKAS